MRNGMGMGMGMGAGGGGRRSPYSAEATAYIAAMASEPNAVQKAQYAARIDAITAVSGLWAKIDQLLFFDAHDAAVALINVKSPGTLNATNNLCTHAAYNGFTGSATVGDNKFINSNVNVSNLSPTRLNNISVFIWVVGIGAGMAGNFFLGALSGSNLLGIYPANNNALPVLRSAINSAAAGFMDSDAIAANAGLFVAVRSGANVINLYHNSDTAIASDTDASVGMPNVDVYYGGNNSSGSLASPMGKQMKIGGVAQAMTGADVAALYAAINSNPITAGV